MTNSSYSYMKFLELVKSLSFKSLGFIVKVLFELSHKFLSNIYNWNSGDVHKRDILLLCQSNLTALNGFI